MSGKRIAIVVSIIGSALLVFAVASGSLTSRIVESDGRRRTEMGVLGSSVVVRTEDVPGLSVRDDVSARVNGIAPPPEGVDLRALKDPSRTRGRENTQWLARAAYSGNPKKLAAYYRRFVTPYSRPSTMMDDVDGTMPDGTDLWICFDKPRKEVIFCLTKPGRGL